MYAYGAGSSESRPYQGYPYLNPVVSDVAVVDNATAARWAALPRRPAASSLYDQPGGSRDIPREATSSQYQGYPYLNPTTSDVGTVDAATAAQWAALPRRPAPSTIYDQPGGSREPVRTPTLQAEETPPEQNTEESDRTEEKIDYDTNPVVYIDLPESSGSEVAEQRRPQQEESFVQQTIFYDPFKDCTVVTVADETESLGSSSVGTNSSNSSLGRPRNRPTRPAPPVTLSLGSPDIEHSSIRGTPGAPPIMSKEASIYGTYPPDNAFPLPEVREFPNPPPAYSEYDPSTIGSPVTQQPAPRPEVSPTTPQTPYPVSPQQLNPATLPKTQVIVPAIDKKTKCIFCKYCGANVLSHPVKQVGFATHLLALTLCMLGLFPCSLILYCTNYCRYKNHYCKQCNQLTAYEIPFLRRGLTYVK